MPQLAQLGIGALILVGAAKIRMAMNETWYDVDGVDSSARRSLI
jgi:hypothetical protein